MANTRITQGVIKPNEDYDVRHVAATGIVTSTGLDVNGNADISGNLSVGGVLTYEDVTNVDSVGVITARSGVDVDDFISVGSNIHLGNAGVITATSFVGSGAALTGIDATAIKDSGGNVKIQAQASGAVHTGISTFDTINVGSGVTIESNGQATFTGIVTFGSNSTTIGDNVINVGTALTLGHTQGVQFHTQNLHSQGFEVNQINASGIITASSFSGDGSNLTSLPAGLGTALSSTQSSPLNKIYYTNTVLPVESTITVDTPASASAAYTQYADISVGSGADLIISDGDDLIPDVLGLRPDGTFGGGALGRMRVDKIVGKDANSAVSFEKGIVITGVTTSIQLQATNINVTGVVTATSFGGSGASLTNLNASNIASGTVPTARLGSGTASSSTFLAGDSTFKTITGTTINNQADNRMITCTGTANTLNAEQYLTYTSQSSLNLTDGNGTSLLGGNYLLLKRTTANTNYINAPLANADLVISADENLLFHTVHTADYNSTERLRITSGGHISQGGGAEPSSTNGSIGLKFGIKSTANNVIIGETTQSSSGHGLHIESRQTGRSGGARIAQIGMKNDANGNGQISFFTSPSGADVSERMVINSSGYVTKAAHPSFCARHQGSDGFSGDIIVLTRISTSWDVWNTGGHYSTSTGKFTAPVTGVYYFEGQLMTTGHSNGNNIQDMFGIMSNHGRITYVRQRESYFSNTTNANGYYTNSCGSAARLSAGDTVWLQRQSGQSWGYSNRYYSYFTGWLIG